MRASRHHGDAAEANDIGREVGWPLRQAGLRLSADGGCLPLPVGREADLSLYERGGRQDAAPLLDDGMPALPAQISVYQGTGAAYHAMGARTPARSCAAESRKRARSTGDPELLRKPITGIGCCARAANGQPTAAPPMSVMNSRRFIQSPRWRGRIAAIRGTD